MAKSHTILIFSLFFILLLASGILSLCTGSVSIPPERVFSILFAKGESFSLQEINIIMQIRFPRLIMAFLLGGALSLSGFLLQTYFQNPIAGPYVLGISSGAKMCVAASMIFFLKNGIVVSSFSKNISFILII